MIMATVAVVFAIVFRDEYISLGIVYLAMLAMVEVMVELFIIGVL